MLGPYRPAFWKHLLKLVYIAKWFKSKIRVQWCVYTCTSSWMFWCELHPIRLPLDQTKHSRSGNHHAIFSRFFSVSRRAKQQNQIGVNTLFFPTVVLARRIGPVFYVLQQTSSCFMQNMHIERLSNDSDLHFAKSHAVVSCIHLRILQSSWQMGSWATWKMKKIIQDSECSLMILSVKMKPQTACQLEVQHQKGLGSNVNFDQYQPCVFNLGDDPKPFEVIRCY